MKNTPSTSICNFPSEMMAQLLKKMNVDESLSLCSSNKICRQNCIETFGNVASSDLKRQIAWTLILQEFAEYFEILKKSQYWHIIPSDEWSNIEQPGDRIMDTNVIDFIKKCSQDAYIQNNYSFNLYREEADLYRAYIYSSMEYKRVRIPNLKPYDYVYDKSDEAYYLAAPPQFAIQVSYRAGEEVIDDVMNHVTHINHNSVFILCKQMEVRQLFLQLLRMNHVILEKKHDEIFELKSDNNSFINLLNSLFFMERRSPPYSFYEYNFHHDEKENYSLWVSNDTVFTDREPFDVLYPLPSL